ncbi:MAG: restriction endonuclease subunit S [Dongiaceae bacterium]
MSPHGESKIWPVVKLGEVAELSLGKMLDAKKNRGRPQPYLRNPNVKWLDFDLSDVRTMRFEEHEDKRYGLLDGDVLICEGGEAGRAAIWDGRVGGMKFQKAIHRVRCGPRLNNRFLVHRLMADYFSGRLADYYTGATIKHLTGQDLARYSFPLPPVAEQRRIAATLDMADGLRAKRRAALAKLDTLTQSIFLGMFGDPATNPKGWPSMALGSLAVRFSDGPFGSNLKSEHYTDAGVRVIRLQNIGIGQFLDADKAFISTLHFTQLKKHECLPGDILVGTLGDPNLRACVQPNWLPIALNKADCVQIRVDDRVATASYVAALLNHPATERMAHRLMHGQTRVRISMGHLRCLQVPVPCLELQRDFAKRISSVESLAILHRNSLSACDALFASLQQRAFRGELFPSPESSPLAAE